MQIKVICILRLANRIPYIPKTGSKHVHDLKKIVCDKYIKTMKPNAELILLATIKQVLTSNSLIKI